MNAEEREIERMLRDWRQFKASASFALAIFLMVMVAIALWRLFA